MSKTVLDAPIYIDTYELAKRVYDLRFALPKRDRAVLGDRMIDAVMAMLSDFTMSYKLAALNVRFNEGKFYMQHYSKGVMMLGTVLKFHRQYANNGTVKRGFRRLRDWAGVGRIRKADLNRMLCSLNTYCGIFKGHNNRRHLELFREEGLRRLGKYVKWNESKKCFNLVRNFNDYLISRYAGRKAV
jgi:hypothetical protein